VPTLTIALIGDPAHAGDRIPEDEWSRSWSERPTIEIEVGEDEPLGSMVDRALSEFAVNLGEGAVSAHRVDLALRQENADEVRVWDLTLVDDEGRVIWTAHDVRFIPYSQLVRSVEAGVVVGDPRSLYLILKEPIGNGLGIDWAEIVQAWQIVDDVVRRIGDYGGAAAALVAAYHLIRTRIARGRDALARNVHRWSQRGGHPYGLFKLLTSRTAWDADDLGRLLGCSLEDAEAVLELFGFSQSDADALWHREADEAARLLSAAFDEAAATPYELIAPGQGSFEARVEVLLRTGERPPEGDRELEEDLPRFLEVVSLGLTSQGVVGHARIGRSEVHVQLAAEEIQGTEFSELWELAYQLLSREISRLGVDADVTASDSLKNSLETNELEG
jgi:hypothetical protein